MKFRLNDRVEITEDSGEYGTIVALSPDHHLPYLVALDSGKQNYFRLDKAVLVAPAEPPRQHTMSPRSAFIYGYYVAKIESLAATMQYMDRAHIADIRAKITESAAGLWDSLHADDGEGRR